MYNIDVPSKSSNTIPIIDHIVVTSNIGFHDLNYSELYVPVNTLNLSHLLLYLRDSPIKADNIASEYCINDAKELVCSTTVMDYTDSYTLSGILTKYREFALSDCYAFLRNDVVLSSGKYMKLVVCYFKLYESLLSNDVVCYMYINHVN